MDDRQFIADLLSALEYHTEQTRPIEFSKVAIEAAREYLRKPAQRTWVGLTAEEIDYLYVEHRGDGGPTAICEQFARAVLTKSKEKNNG